MTLSKISIIPEVLLTVTQNVWHYEAFEQKDKYIVWAEDREGSSLYSENQKAEQVIQGTIDYFTKQEGDPAVEQIQEALSTAEVSFYLSSVQYENETGFIHYEWVWEVV